MPSGKVMIGGHWNSAVKHSKEIDASTKLVLCVSVILSNSNNHRHL